jgi:hypothetical protein
MIFRFNKTTKEITVFEETTFGMQGILERQDIEEWIENNPEILGEDLLVITTEYDKFDKTDERLDILALDTNGVLVIVELKKDDSGKNVDVQAIKYASYCSSLTLNDVINIHQQYLQRKGKPENKDNIKKKITDFTEDENLEIAGPPRVILVSKNFRQEVTSFVLFLLKNSKLDIKCIKLTPYEASGDSIEFEVSTLIPLPQDSEFMITNENEEVKKYGQISEDRLEFFNHITSVLKEKIPNFSCYRVGNNWINFSFFDKRNPRFSVSFHKKTTSIELEIDSRGRIKNKDIINKLEPLKNELESKLKEPVSFERILGYERIRIQRDGKEITDELKNWIVEKMEIFYSILGPEVIRVINQV